MTYQEMCEFQTLYEAYLEARKGKRSKPGTAQYEANALICTDKLSYVLNQKTYKPSSFEVFYVYEPKKRLVQAPAFVDKVVLHALTDNVLYDTICTSFIRDNHASQRGQRLERPVCEDFPSQRDRNELQLRLYAERRRRGAGIFQGLCGQ